MTESLVNNREPVYSEFKDDEDFFELLEMFASSIPEKLILMRQAFSGNHTEQLQTYSHQLKGSGAGYGFSELSELAGHLEIACKQKDLIMIAGALEKLVDHMSRITL